jgi:hypothetical protein
MSSSERDVRPVRQAYRLPCVCVVESQPRRLRVQRLAIRSVKMKRMAEVGVFGQTEFSIIGG